MKYAFWILLVSNLAHADGYRCHALCVVPVPNGQEFYIIGDVEVEAGVSASQTFSLLRKKCGSEAWRYEGFDYGSVIVDGLNVRSSSEEEWYSVRHSTQTAATIYYGYRFRYSTRARSYESRIYSYSRRELDFQFTLPRPATACENDPTIATGLVPYVGRLPIQE